MYLPLKYKHESFHLDLLEVFDREISPFIDTLHELQRDYIEKFSIGVYKDIPESEEKDFKDEHDIEVIGGWFAVKIFDNLSFDSIDEFSLQNFPLTIEKIKNIPGSIRAYIHIVNGHGTVAEHTDSEYGYQIDETPVYNYVIGVRIPNDNFTLIFPKKDDRRKVQESGYVTFDANYKHSAINDDDSPAILLVLHIDRECFEFE